MADAFGQLEFPAQSVFGAALSDPALAKLGDFFQAVLNAQLAESWAQATTAQHENRPVKKVNFYDPMVVGLTDGDLPALFLWRDQAREERLTDDWHTDHAEIVALWIPPRVAPNEVARRVAFLNGVCKVMFHALVLGRHPAYVDAEDSDADARTLGSVLTDVCGFLKPPRMVGAKPLLAAIPFDTDKSSVMRKYPAARAVFETIETSNWDPSLRGTPAAHTTSLENNGVGLVELQDPLE